jgi:hypothetical protein
MMEEYVYPHKMDGRNSGMTLRDYFAGQALTSLKLELFLNDEDGVAKLAYLFADAMLKAR